MARAVWIAVAFVAGVVVGAAVMRMGADATRADPSPAVSAPASPAPVAEVERVAGAAAGAQAISAPASVAAPAAASAPAAGAGAQAGPDPPVSGMSVPPVAASAPRLVATPTQGVNPFPPLPDDGSPVLQPLDVGEPLREVMNKLTPEGDTIADAHRALERETRDENWSYRSESNIQNTLIPETAAGNFKAHYVECRATLCEVRLSAQNEVQGEALRVWGDGLGKQPWAKQLFPMYSSSITKNGQTDRVIIFRRPKQ